MTVVQSARDTGESARAAAVPEAPPVGGAYARFVLAVLTLVYVFNMIDRYVLSILAERIKADLGIGDAQLGFLYGTAFAVFFAIFGIAFGRLADTSRRTRLISIGLAFWSVMTMASGAARNFGALAVCRFGVGVGESSASPAATSMLSDYFPPSIRATVISIYSSGTAIGAGLGLIIGGAILDVWTRLFPDADAAPLHLRGWQAAFLAVGLPGVLLSVLVAGLREPPRGRTDGVSSAEAASAWRVLGAELASILPPFTFATLLRPPNPRSASAINLAAAGLFAAAAWALSAWLGSPLQWAALALGAYCALSWAQSLAYRDRPAFQLIFRSPSFLLSVLAFPMTAFSAQSIAFWAVPFLIRVHGASAGHVGAWVGSGAALGGWAGVTLGGLIADRLQKRVRGARHLVAMAAILILAPAALLFLITPRLEVAFLASFAIFFAGAMPIGPGFCIFMDLVLPRMRGTATAFAAFVNTLLGLALGPYVTGRLSDAFAAAGAAPGEALRRGMMLALLPSLVAFALLMLARTRVEREMASKLESARALGEPV